MKASLAVLACLLVTSIGPSAATVPFDTASGRPMVELMVNGKGPFPFVFDTGMPGLVVMPSLVDELALQATGSTAVNSPAGGTPVESDVVAVGSVTLGGAEVTGLEAIVLDMAGANLGQGVVGPSVFRKHGPTSMDFAENTITIGNAASPAGVETWLPFGKSAPLLDVPVRVGGARIDGHIDTGSPGTLSVPDRYEDRLKLSGPIRTVGRGRTIDAEFEIRAAPIEGPAQVGDAEIPLREVYLSALPVANLGTAGLRGLQLYIDWDNKRFALTGTGRPATGPQRMVRAVPAGDGPRFGMRAMPSPGGGIQVAGTDPGSLAEALGLLAGDTIVAINGKSTKDLEVAQVRTELQVPELELTVERDGKTVKLKRPTGEQG